MELKFIGKIIAFFQRILFALGMKLSKLDNLEDIMEKIRAFVQNPALDFLGGDFKKIVKAVRNYADVIVTLTQNLDDTGDCITEQTTIEGQLKCFLNLLHGMNETEREDAFRQLSGELVKAEAGDENPDMNNILSTLINEASKQS